MAQNKMAEGAESDIAISIVDENDYREISAKAVSASPDMFCTAFSHAKHPRSARGHFIPILKITGDELPME